MKPGRKPQSLADRPPHGTIHAYWRHKRLRERACIRCLGAYAEYMRDYYQRRKAEADLEQLIRKG